MGTSYRALAGALALALGTAGPVRAQRLLDWSARTRVEPEALARGPLAALWNPAALASPPFRREALLLALRSPADVGLNGAAAAATLRLGTTGALGLAYQHLGIDDIQHTDAAPPPDATSDLFAVGEDRLALAGGQALGRGTRVGARLEYERTTVAGAADGSLALGAGALFAPGGALAPEVGACASRVAGATRWNAGAGASAPPGARLPLELRAAYGMAGRSDRPGLEHRLSLTGDWRGLVTAAAAETRAAGGGEWTPSLMAEVRAGHYLLGAVYETRAGDFGGTTSVHLGVRF